MRRELPKRRAERYPRHGSPDKNAEAAGMGEEQEMKK